MSNGTLGYETSKIGPTTSVVYDEITAASLELVDEASFVKASFALHATTEVYLRQGNGTSGHTCTSDDMNMKSSMRWRVDVDTPSERFVKVLGVSAGGTLKSTKISASS